ncbi:MAG: FtsQ-type POTRA domain-containing protein [Syntrophomonadaceae bacterium]|nr:FtsQ-type POTRA domain-containing protein [Syntrophomonadaceae bacterium]
MKQTSHRFIRFSILMLIIVVSSYLFLHSSFFNIEKVEVVGLNLVSREEVINLASITIGGNIFKLNEESVIRAVKTHPMIKKATLSRHLPRTVEIMIEERKIWALIPYNDIVLCVAEDGICIDKSTHFEASYPIITADEMPARVNLGQPVYPAAVSLAKKIWDSLSENDQVQISEFHYENKSKEMIIYTVKGTEIRFGNADRFQEKVGQISQTFAIEADFAENGMEALEYIDLRFKGQPVVKTRD